MPNDGQAPPIIPSTSNYSQPAPPPAEAASTYERTPNNAAASVKGKEYIPNPRTPIYSTYGSSVVDVKPDLTPFNKEADLSSLSALTGNALDTLDAMKARTSAATRGSDADGFDPAMPHLPQGNWGNIRGLYSASGFDLIGVLARVAARPNPQIEIGPIDTSVSFLVVDARKYDFPIVYASDSFSTMTGYTNAEIVGRNCRFLQWPDGTGEVGQKRLHTDGNAAYHMKSHIMAGKESQTSLINYRKDGSAFINLCTIIPITWDTDEIAYFVGLQIDLVEQPNAIMSRVSYRHLRMACK